MTSLILFKANKYSMKVQINPNTLFMTYFDILQQ